MRGAPVVFMERIPEVKFREQIGDAQLPDGRTVAIVATTHDIEWPGTGSKTTYAVEISGNQQINPVSYGFFDEGEAFRFCSSRYCVRTQILPDGSSYEEPLEGLHLADWRIRKYAADINTGKLVAGRAALPLLFVPAS